MEKKPLHSVQTCGILRIQNGWAVCPVCGWARMMRVEPDTQAKRLPVYCKRCHNETIVNIEPESQCQCASAT